MANSFTSVRSLLNFSKKGRNEGRKEAKEGGREEGGKERDREKAFP